VYAQNIFVFRHSWETPDGRRRRHLSLFNPYGKISDLSNADSSIPPFSRNLTPTLDEVLGRGHTKEIGNRNATVISENCYQPKLSCFAVASFLGVPSPLLYSTTHFSCIT
jgi:hypothetical protein